ncbi:molecular chaperone TorD family protein [Tissierella carlieri]|uniref:Molecular chaperone TorD family protein n=1 Tax=Tissierella carlieri TaxID=689904 RepID=A0ABT1SGQ6_9FIRM|nr:molecular chaperone TorD family protein [Tissierella carlieri]MCQ4925660.1 molecular chaperone TorD family protein [Tissierella carlieri]
MPNNNVSAMDRGGLYELIASLYLQLPTIENVEQVSNALTNAKDIFHDIDFSKLIVEVKQRKEKLTKEPDYIEELEQEYYDHFLVPIANSYIPPYESFIRGAIKLAPGEGRKNKGGWKYNRSTVLLDYNVNLAYDSVGFQPQNMNIIKELKHQNKMDHLGFELAFMAFLCNMESQELFNEEQESDSESNIKNSVKWYNLQTQFLKEHLLSFINTYYKISIEKSKPFYRSLSELLNNYIDWDLKNR